MQAAKLTPTEPVRSAVEAAPRGLPFLMLRVDTDWARRVTRLDVGAKSLRAVRHGLQGGVCETAHVDGFTSLSNRRSVMSSQQAPEDLRESKHTVGVMTKSWSLKLAAFVLAMMATTGMWLLLERGHPQSPEGVYVINVHLPPFYDINCWDGKHHTKKKPCPF